MGNTATKGDSHGRSPPRHASLQPGLPAALERGALPHPSALPAAGQPADSCLAGPCPRDHSVVQIPSAPGAADATLASSYEVAVALGAAAPGKATPHGGRWGPLQGQQGQVQAPKVELLTTLFAINSCWRPDFTVLKYDAIHLPDTLLGTTLRQLLEVVRSVVLLANLEVCMIRTLEGCKASQPHADLRGCAWTGDVTAWLASLPPYARDAVTQHFPDFDATNRAAAPCVRTLASIKTMISEELKKAELVIEQLMRLSDISDAAGGQEAQLSTTGATSSDGSTDDKASAMSATMGELGSSTGPKATLEQSQGVPGCCRLQPALGDTLHQIARAFNVYQAHGLRFCEKNVPASGPVDTQTPWLLANLARQVLLLASAAAERGPKPCARCLKVAQVLLEEFLQSAIRTGHCEVTSELYKDIHLIDGRFCYQDVPSASFCAASSAATEASEAFFASKSVSAETSDVHPDNNTRLDASGRLAPDPLKSGFKESTQSKVGGLQRLYEQMDFDEVFRCVFFKTLEHGRASTWTLLTSMPRRSWMDYRSNTARAERGAQNALRFYLWSAAIQQARAGNLDWVPDISDEHWSRMKVMWKQPALCKPMSQALLYVARQVKKGSGLMDYGLAVKACHMAVFAESLEDINEAVSFIASDSRNKAMWSSLTLELLKDLAGHFPHQSVKLLEMVELIPVDSANFIHNIPFGISPRLQSVTVGDLDEFTGPVRLADADVTNPKGQTSSSRDVLQSTSMFHSFSDTAASPCSGEDGKHQDDGRFTGVYENFMVAYQPDPVVQAALLTKPRAWPGLVLLYIISGFRRIPALELIVRTLGGALLAFSMQGLFSLLLSLPIMLVLLSVFTVLIPTLLAITFVKGWIFGHWLLYCVQSILRCAPNTFEDLWDFTVGHNISLVKMFMGWDNHYTTLTCARVPVPLVYSRQHETELLERLLQAPRVPLSVYGCKMLRAIINFKWNYFTRFLIIMQLLLHVAYMVIFILYAYSIKNMETVHGRDGSGYGLTGPANCHTAAPTLTQAWYLIVLGAMTIEYAIQETRQRIYFGLRYFLNGWELLDLVSTTLMFLIVTTHFTCGLGINPGALRVMSSVQILLLCGRLLYYCMSLEKLGSFVRMVAATSVDLFIFFIFLGIVFVGFALAVIFAQGPESNTGDSNRAVYEQLYTLMFGGVDPSFLAHPWQDYGEAQEPRLVSSYISLLAVVFMIVVSIILLNLLIAIINESYGYIRGNRSLELLRNKASLIVSTEALFRGPGLWSLFSLVFRGSLSVDPIEDVYKLLEPAGWSRKASCRNASSAERYIYVLRPKQPRVVQQEGGGTDDESEDEGSNSGEEGSSNEDEKNFKRLASRLMRIERMIASNNANKCASPLQDASSGRSSAAGSPRCGASVAGLAASLSPPDMGDRRLGEILESLATYWQETKLSNACGAYSGYGSVAGTSSRAKGGSPKAARGPPSLWGQLGSSATGTGPLLSGDALLSGETSRHPPPPMNVALVKRHALPGSRLSRRTQAEDEAVSPPQTQQQVVENDLAATSGTHGFDGEGGVLKRVPHVQPGDNYH